MLLLDRPVALKMADGAYWPMLLWPYLHSFRAAVSKGSCLGFKACVADRS